jgi:hypothetical protein
MLVLLVILGLTLAAGALLGWNKEAAPREGAGGSSAHEHRPATASARDPQAQTTPR